MVSGGEPIDPSARGAAERGTAALRPLLAQMDAASLAIPDYLARRYGRTELADAGDRARRMVAAGGNRTGSVVLDRLVDPNATAPKRSQLVGIPRYELAIARALYCRNPAESDRRSSLPALIRSVAASGGYSLTHATVAFALAREQGCIPARPATALQGELGAELRSEVDSATTVDDLAIERLAMLALLGERLPAAPVAALVAAQRADGSWVDPTNRVPSWHPTMLAVWALSAAADRGEAVPFLPTAAMARDQGKTAADGARSTAPFTAAEARRRPPADRADRVAIARLSRDPQPSTRDQHDMAAQMEQFGPVAQSAPTDPTVAQQLSSELTAAGRSAAALATPAAATRAGYRLTSRFLPGIGAHWVDWSRVTRPFSARSPAMLLFDGNGAEAKLVGLSYLVRSRTAPVGFSAGGASWHRHEHLCIVNGMLVGEHASASTCARARGSLLPGRDLWMLHVWAVPGRANPWGTFAPMNPDLCDAASPCSP